MAAANSTAHVLPAGELPGRQGLRLGYRSMGQGPALVFLHGIASGAGSWRLQQPLAAQFRCIQWDAPGYGESQALAQPNPTAADYAAALCSLLDRLRLRRVVLVGHSLGAMIAAAFAARWPQRVAALVLADPAQGYGAASPEQRERVRTGRVALLRELGADGYARQRAAALLHPQACAQRRCIVEASMRRLQLEGFTQACAMLAGDDIWHYLPAWQGPLQVLCGQQDAITPLAGVELLAARMGVACQVLPDAGHASYIDAPEAFNTAVTTFLQGLGDRPGSVAYPGHEENSL